MRIATLLAGAVLAVGISASASSATAAPFIPEVSGHQSIVEQTRHWRRHHWDGGWRRCGFWRRECADRWGWGGRGYRRCLWRHGC
ncbi:MAG: glycosyl hydrolase family 5 [Hyphomicrobium sp.]